ncbi:MAG: hypothetical protein NT000_04775 [Proteobacteria bacterium]|nr:hypothetical protein [Pseudomonadota bacterium]
MKKLILIVPFLFLACTKFKLMESTAPVIQSPTEIVKLFVQLSASAKSPGDKRRLIEASGGDFKRAFERMSDEEFKLTYLNGQIKIENINVLDSVIEVDKAKVRYQVSLENKQGTETTLETNEREVELRKGDSGWLIEAIRLKGSDKIAFTRGMMF